jgi:flagellar biogenesis protein FliO
MLFIRVVHIHFYNPSYMLNNFTHFLLSLIGILALVSVVGFLLFGFMKGILMERELRLRRRRRYF